MLNPGNQAMAAGAQDMQFGPFRLDRRSRSLTRDGDAVSIGGRAFDILSVLAGAAGETVGKAALLDRVWPGVVVEENNLQVHISALRKVLGKGWITTVPGRGYQLAIPATESSSNEHARRARGEPSALTDRPSVAVLPFGNPSGDADEEYFCEGLADDIINALARSRSLLVIARNSSFACKGRSIEVKQIASDSACAMSSRAVSAAQPAVSASTRS